MLYDNPAQTFHTIAKGIRFLNICDQIDQTINGRVEEEEQFGSSSSYAEL
jgi:hypothetical protein